MSVNHRQTKHVTSEQGRPSEACVHRRASSPFDRTRTTAAASGGQGEGDDAALCPSWGRNRQRPGSRSLSPRAARGAGGGSGARAPPPQLNGPAFLTGRNLPRLFVLFFRAGENSTARKPSGPSTRAAFANRTCMYQRGCRPDCCTPRSLTARPKRRGQVVRARTAERQPPAARVGRALPQTPPESPWGARLHDRMAERQPCARLGHMDLVSAMLWDRRSGLVHAREDSPARRSRASGCGSRVPLLEMAGILRWAYACV